MTLGLASAEAKADGPVVAAFERFRGEWAPEVGGRLLLTELNCIACHRDESLAKAPVQSKQAPVLDKIGTRARPEYLRAYLADPHKAKPGTTMPDLLGGLPEPRRAETVEALVHFLASTGSPREARPSRQAASRGEKLYRQTGCLACHGPRDGRGGEIATSVPLGDLAAKYTIPGLAEFLQNPLQHRPSGRMPGMLLKDTEAPDLAHYLLQDLHLDLPTSAEYAYYEGDWQELPDFRGLEPVATGRSAGFDVGVARKTDNFALRFDATFALDRAGEYTFTLASDDGSRLEIDGGQIVNNDGVHPKLEARGRARLGAGDHRVVVAYFEGGGEEELDVEIEGPQLPRQPLANLLKRLGGDGGPAPFRPDPALAARGRGLFGSLGCASCHGLKVDNRAIASELKAGALADLDGTKGCLADRPGPASPRYGLDPGQRRALAAALKAPVATEPRAIVAATFAAFNCYACHQRGGAGGVEEARNAFFETTQKDVGDEVRIPPALDGVGAKLHEGYTKKLLGNGAKDRPYMLARMPRFAAGNVGHLATLFAQLDPIGPVPPPETTEPERRLKTTGRLLAGKQALNCVSCHTFNGSQAAGIQVIDMVLMPQRLRREWFERYLVDPQAFRPGTRMPSSWPNGKTMLPAVLDGTASLQIESIWRYLADGRDATPPLGIGRDPIPLVARDEAIIYRNFIEGAGPRAIGVGYPEKANVAFDANDMRLALIWQGDFIDASRHWTGRGEGYQPPLGDNVLALPAGPSFARLETRDALWPTDSARTHGFRFRGYELGQDRRPTFRYDFGPVHVADFPDAVKGPKAASIRRTITLTSEGPAGDLYFRAAVADRVDPAGDNFFRINGDWKLRIGGGGATPIVRDSRGKQELLLPIRLDREPVTIVEEIVW